MLKNRKVRRAVAALLCIAGAALLLFAPETWAGVLLLALGVSIEAVGIAIGRR